MDIQEYLNNQMNPQELAEMVHKHIYWRGFLVKIGHFSQYLIL